MIIKRFKAAIDRASTVPSGGPAGWSLDAFREGLMGDRRERDEGGYGQDRRRGHRRGEDENMVAHARQEATAIRQRAEAEGFEAGLKRAEAEMGRLRQLFDGLLNARTEAYQAMEADVAPLAVTIAEKLMKTQVLADESVVTTLVEKAIEKLARDSQSLVIFVHPVEVSRVRDWLKERHWPWPVRISVEESTDVTMGSCKVETDGGLVDFSFDTQLDMLTQLLGIQKPMQPQDIQETDTQP